MGHGYCFDTIVRGQHQNGINLWEIYSKAGGGHIGEVSWSPIRRAYVFCSRQGTQAMTAATLLDLGRFCKLQTEAQLKRKVAAAG